MKRFCSQKGMTLVELIVGMMIMLIILEPMARMLKVAVESWQQGRARIEIQHNARYAVDLMRREMTFGTNFVVENGNSVVFDDLREGRPENAKTRFCLNSFDNKLYREPVSPVDGSREPMTGSNVPNFAHVVVNKNGEPLFYPVDNYRVVINIIVTDLRSNQSVRLRTMVCSIAATVNAFQETETSETRIESISFSE